jgi:hypothetical protein
VSRRPKQNPLDEVASKLAALEAIMDVLRTHGVIRTRTVKARKPLGAKAKAANDAFKRESGGSKNPVEETWQ